jgi:hypothetical protein
MLVVVMALREWEEQKKNSSQEELNKLKLEEQSKYNDLFLKQQHANLKMIAFRLCKMATKRITIENQRYKEK